MNEYIVTIGENKRAVRIIDEGRIEVNGKIISCELSKVNDCAYLLKLDNNVYEITSSQLNKEKNSVFIDGYYFETSARTKLQEAASDYLKNKININHHTEIKAPMPGLILKLYKKTGDRIKIGEPVLILEAMKMENEIRSPGTGIVKEIFVKPGNSVEKDFVILTIE